jgi:proteasome beta subunit
MERHDAIVLILRSLDSAAEFDSATGGVNAAEGVYPVVKLITADGIAVVSAEELTRLYREQVDGRRV